MEISNNLLNMTIYKSRKKVSLNNIEEPQSQTACENTILNQIETKVLPSQSGISSLKSIISSDIKAAIYNYSHPSISGVTTTYGTTFNEICSTLNIGPNSSITKADLTKLTRNDVSEDSNKDFFGALNRAFSYLSPEETISYNDLMLFFMRGAGSDGQMNFNEYVNVVNTYSDIVQQQFEACTTAQQKLEFAIEKTKDYLIESRMDMQLNALNRLITEPCASQNVPNPDPKYIGAIQQDAHVGQIAFADLGDYQEIDPDGIAQSGDEYRTVVQGAYQSWSSNDYYTVNDSDVSMWVADYDAYYSIDGNNYWGDTGITLNSRYYLQEQSIKWYELVEVFVHELTHATAYYYYNVDNSANSSFSQRGLDFMLSKGFITAGQYTTASNSPELMYLVTTMWDEWAAYTTSCNYFDSIGGDVFDSANDLAVNGSQEKNAIRQHLKDTGYDEYDSNGVWKQRPQPDYKNWDWNTFNNMFYYA